MTTVGSAGSWVRFGNPNEARLDWPVLALMWAGLAGWLCLPVRDPKLWARDATGGTGLFRAAGDALSTPKLHAATPDTWRIRSLCIVSHFQNVFLPTLTYFGAHDHPVHFHFASLTRSAQRECVDSPLLFLQLAGVGNQNPR